MKTSHKLAAALLAVVLLIALNVVAAFLPTTLDLTADRLYTLSPATQRILGGLEEPVTLEFYHTRSAELPVAFKNFAERVRDMLRRYERLGGGNVRLRIIDAEQDTPEEERALRLGLQARQDLRGTNFLFGLAVVLADRQRTIPLFDPNRDRFLEYDISQLIVAVQRAEKPRLGFLTALPLAPEPPNPFAQQAPQGGSVFHTQLESVFEVVPIPMTATELPENLAALAVIHPSGITPALEYAIDQFVLSGKPAFLAVDPSSLLQRSRQGQQMMFLGGGDFSSNLRTLFNAWGIEYDPAQVIGDLDYAATVSRGGVPQSDATVLSLDAEALNRDLPNTSELESLLLVEAGAFAKAPDAAIEFIPVATTSARAAPLASAILQMTPRNELARNVVPTGTRYTLAAVVRGRLNSAFPNGAPTPPPPAEGEAPTPPPTPAAHLAASTGDANLFLIADSDWLLDNFAVRLMDFLGMRSYMAINGNLALAVGTLETYAGASDLVALRARQTSLRPFDVVDAMERKAQERYQEQLEQLDGRLAELDRQLNELLERQNKEQMLVATPEIEASIRAFQEEQAQARAERRVIRRALSQEIDGLTNRLALLNLLAVPTLLTLLGLAFFRVRRNRRLAGAAATR